MEVWKKRRRARKRSCEWIGNAKPVVEEVVDIGDEDEGKKRAYPRPRFHPTLCGV